MKMRSDWLDMIISFLWVTNFVIIIIDWVVWFAPDKWLSSMRADVSLLDIYDLNTWYYFKYLSTIDDNLAKMCNCILLTQKLILDFSFYGFYQKCKNKIKIKINNFPVNYYYFILFYFILICDSSIYCIIIFHLFHCQK